MSTKNSENKRKITQPKTTRTSLGSIDHSLVPRQRANVDIMGLDVTSAFTNEPLEDMTFDKLNPTISVDRSFQIVRSRLKDLRPLGGPEGRPTYEQ